MNDAEIHGIFPCPVYLIKRDIDLSSREEKDISRIIKRGVYKNYGNSTTEDHNIFNNRLEKIKRFCELHLDNYIKQIIVPNKKINLYITQSWLNVTKPNEFHHEHFHQNSIISGVFYVSTVENDSITFFDPNSKIKNLIKITTNEYNPFNSTDMTFSVKDNQLILFPSWMNHSVQANKSTKDRISISFNTFVRGSIGVSDDLNELVLVGEPQETSG